VKDEIISQKYHVRANQTAFKLYSSPLLRASTLARQSIQGAQKLMAKEMISKKQTKAQGKILEVEDLLNREILKAMDVWLNASPEETRNS
jgi:hypothetical protein